MNANELADELDCASSDMEYNYHVSDWKLLSEAATMLRQLQAENEALKRDCINYLKDNTRLSDQILLLKKDK